MLEETIAIEPVQAFRLFAVNHRGECGSAGYGAGQRLRYRPGNKYRAGHVISLFNIEETHRPFAECKCGFYGWKSADALNLPENLRHLHGLYYGGPVLLSGIVVEHEFGYRATEMTVLPFELVIQRYYDVRHVCTYLEDPWYEVDHSKCRQMNGWVRYSMAEWNTAIQNDPWPQSGIEYGIMLPYITKEIDLERIQSEPHSGE